ncbi:MAG: phosphate propanoyltransferase [bacterium]
MNIKVPVGVSARHAHLSKEDLEVLFGEGYELTHFKDLSQPGQFACEEKIDVVSLDPKGKTISGVRILGPLRSSTQIELVRSDAIKNKFVAPVRSSGDIKDSGSAKLVGPKGEIIINEGVIVADRHIHMSTKEAAEFGIVDRQIVSLKVEGAKGGILGNVLCRVNDNFALDCHIDTDDACAFEVKQNDLLEVLI